MEIHDNLGFIYLVCGFIVCLWFIRRAGPFHLHLGLLMTSVFPSKPGGKLQSVEGPQTVTSMRSILLNRLTLNLLNSLSRNHLLGLSKQLPQQKREPWATPGHTHHCGWGLRGSQPPSCEALLPKVTSWGIVRALSAAVCLLLSPAQVAEPGNLEMV